MLIYSMSVSVDGFIADREGGFEWTVPSSRPQALRFPFTVSDDRRHIVSGGEVSA